MVSAKEYEIVKVRGLFGKVKYVFKDKETGERYKAKFEEIKCDKQADGNYVYYVKDEKGWAFFNPETQQPTSDHYPSIEQYINIGQYMVGVPGRASYYQFYNANNDELYDGVVKTSKIIYCEKIPKTQSQIEEAIDNSPEYYFVYVDPETGEELGPRFKKIVHVDNNLCDVDPETGEELGPRFKKIVHVDNNLCVVRINGQDRFYRYDTKEFYKEGFNQVLFPALSSDQSQISFFKVKKNRSWGLYSLELHEWLPFPSDDLQDFVSFSYKVGNNKMYRGHMISQYGEPNQYVIYDPRNNYISQGMDLETAQKINKIIVDVAENPKKFGELPTGFFRDVGLIRIILNAISGEINYMRDKNGFSDELRKYAADVGEMLDEKIKQEKANIKAEDEEAKKNPFSTINENSSSLGD